MNSYFILYNKCFNLLFKKCYLIYFVTVFLTFDFSRQPITITGLQPSNTWIIPVKVYTRRCKRCNVFTHLFIFIKQFFFLLLEIKILCHILIYLTYFLSSSTWFDILIYKDKGILKWIQQASNIIAPHFYIYSGIMESLIRCLELEVNSVLCCFF